MTDKPDPPVRLDENGHPIVEPPRKEDDERQDAPLKRMGRAHVWCDGLTTGEAALQELARRAVERHGDFDLDASVDFILNGPGGQ